MNSALSGLVAHRELLWNWAVREVTIRYKQSLLGVAWAVLQPLSMTLVFTIVFGLFARVETGGIPYPLFAYCALLPWTLFSNGLSFAAPSVVNNMSLITKIYFPREVLPLASILASLFDFAVAALIFIGLMIFYQVPVNPLLALIPVVLVIQIAFTIGLSLLASAVNVFFRDVRLIIPLAMQLWMYASPVIYPVDSVPESLRSLYLLNPMAPIIDAYRRILLQNQMPDWGYLMLAAGFSLLLLFAGFLFFKRVEMTFADVV